MPTLLEACKAVATMRHCKDANWKDAHSRLTDLCEAAVDNFTNRPLHIPLKYAYLIVIVDRESLTVKGATIWSSPEWEQSRCLDHPTFVAWKVGAGTYQEARDTLLRLVRSEYNRYHWLVPFINKET